jgi:palmitoyltransferase ZDHHC13/17
MSRSHTPSAARQENMESQNGTGGHDNSQVELQEMISGKPRLPIEEDIMQLARLGEIKAIDKLFKSGKFEVQYKDEQGITPLHVRRRTSTVVAYMLNS